MASGVVVTDRGAVRVLELSNPKRRNALDPGLLCSLRKELARAPAGGARCLVLKGAGDAAFSAGFDLEALEKASERSPDEEVELACRAVERCPLPVVAYLNGAAYGGACDLACACDLRVARAGAKLCVPPARLGIIYRPEGIARMASLAGPSRARWMFYTGEPVDAARALAWGLVDVVEPAARAFDAAIRLAEGIARNAPLAVQGMKKAFAAVGAVRLEGGEVAALARERRRSYASADAREGREAIREGRAPKFRGK